MRPVGLSVSFFLLFVLIFLTEASQSIDPINVHSAATTNTLSATPSEGQSRVNLVLDSNQRIQHHGPSLIQIQCVRLHARLRRRLIWVPSVDVESLGLRIFRGCGVFDGACL